MDGNFYRFLDYDLSLGFGVQRYFSNEVEQFNLWCYNCSGRNLEDI